MLDARITTDLTDRYQRLLEEKALLTRAELDAYHQVFQQRFGPKVLADLGGEELLSVMHEHNNRESLVYWLEFKNDDEFPTDRFGGIGGGSALKYGLYRRNETGSWMTGSPRNQREITIPEAINLAQRHRDQLLKGAALLEKFQPGVDSAFAELETELNQVAPDVQDFAWGHKYLSLLYPGKLDDFHNADYQRYYLVKLLQEPPSGTGRYACAGRFVAAAAELGLPISHLTSILIDRNGRPHRYWRIGTSDGRTARNWWESMRDGGYVGVGWSGVTDLSELSADAPGKESLRSLMATAHPGIPQVVGRNTQQLFQFVTQIAKGDLVLAADGNAILGVGRVSSTYWHHPGSDFPHRRSVEWLSLKERHLPLQEGLRTTVYPIRKYINLVDLETFLLEAGATGGGVVAPELPRTGPAPGNARNAPVVLPGLLGRIQSVLGRKGQVILYGPPGTGKTYWAMAAARELASQAAYGCPFAALDSEGREKVLGPKGDGLVRVCAFHPAYGYEDFLEGFRPAAASGELHFTPRDGIFKKLCDDASKDPGRRYVLIVDEINRGDIPRIFGELLTVLDREMRGHPIVLPLTGAPLAVPENVWLIGTMNTADRSIALLDVALRRRFGFIELMPDSKVLGSSVLDGIPLGPWLSALNQRVCEHIGRDARNLQVGHSYLMERGKPVGDFASFARIVQEDIVPLLEEYCYEDFDALERILGPGLVDRAALRIKHELFEPSRQADLVAALLAPSAGITTLLLATTLEDKATLEEPEDSEEADAPASS